MKSTFVVLALFAGLACATYFTDAPETFELVTGWYKGRMTFYYDFGPRSPTTNGGGGVQSAPILVLVTGFDSNQNPILVPGQHNIIDVIPDDVGYSDLWQVKFLTVPSDYVANTVRDYSDAISAFGTGTNGPLVNCPLVPIGSTLDGPGPNITQGWYRNQSVEYYDFGVNPSFTILLYNFPTVPDQHNIIDSIPDDSGYSAFWQIASISPPSDYEANSARSFQDVTDMGLDVYITSNVRNCPVVKTDDDNSSSVMVVHSVIFCLLAMVAVY